MSTELIHTQNRYQFVAIATSKKGKIQLIKHYSSLTLPKIISEKYPTISEVKRQLGEAKVNKAISVLLEDLNQSFKSKITPIDQEEIATELQYSIYKNLSLEDVYFALRTLKIEKIQLRNLNVNMIMATIKQHFDKKTRMIIKHNENQALNHRVEAQKVFGKERTSEAKSIKQITEKTKHLAAAKKYKSEKSKTK